MLLKRCVFCYCCTNRTNFSISVNQHKLLDFRISFLIFPCKSFVQIEKLKSANSRFIHFLKFCQSLLHENSYYDFPTQFPCTCVLMITQLTTRDWPYRSPEWLSVQLSCFCSFLHIFTTFSILDSHSCLLKSNCLLGSAWANHICNGT